MIEKKKEQKNKSFGRSLGEMKAMISFAIIGVFLASLFAGNLVYAAQHTLCGEENYKLIGSSFVQADINQDSSVNVIDLGILMSDFGKSAQEAGNPRSDINSDGIVNVQDLGMMMSEWGG